jgi:hypothetical protein
MVHYFPPLFDKCVLTKKLKLTQLKVKAALSSSIYLSEKCLRKEDMIEINASSYHIGLEYHVEALTYE